MKIATKIKDMKNFNGQASLYSLSEPLEGNDHVIVSAVVAPFSGPETYIFPANADGSIKDWGELEGSTRGALDHAKALGNAGYKIAATMAAR